MTRVAVRLTKLEAAMPKPVARVAYDLSRLTADQLNRIGELRGRIDAVGLAGLTDAEVEEGAELTAILLAPDPPEHAP